MTDLSQHFNTAKLLRYSLPMMAMMLLTSCYGIVDGLFVSNFVGKTAFASVTIVMPFVMILSTVGMMMGSGGSALVGRLLGAKRDAEANAAFSLIAWTTFGIGIVAAVLGIMFMDPIVRLLGANDAMAELASLYGRIAFLSMPMFMLQYTFEVFAATSGKPQLGLYSAIVAGIVNIALDALFLAVLGWGVVGAAAATAIAEYTAAGLLLVIFLRGKAGMLRLGRPSRDLRVLAKASYNGVSEMVGSMAASVVAVVYNLQLMAYIGENGVAAYGAIEYIAMLFGAVLGGYVEGTAPLMSYQHGAENDVEKRSLLRHGIAFMIAGGIGMCALSQLLAYPPRVRLHRLRCRTPLAHPNGIPDLQHRVYLHGLHDARFIRFHRAGEWDDIGGHRLRAYRHIRDWLGAALASAIRTDEHLVGYLRRRNRRDST